jgi:hypothetical protein
MQITFTKSTAKITANQSRLGELIGVRQYEVQRRYIHREEAIRL